MPRCAASPWLLPRPLIPLMLALLWAHPLAAGQASARLLAERTAVAPGTAAGLLLVLEIAPGWHTYWRNPGDSGEPPRVDWTLPPGIVAAPLGFPRPELIRVGPLANYGYSGRALHPVSLEVPRDWPAGTPIPIRAQAHWLVCQEHCIPESADLSLSLPTADRPGPPDPATAAAFGAARAGMPAAEIPDARLRADPDRAGLHLLIPWAEGRPAPAEASFLPYRWGLIEHAAPQPWRLSAGRLTLDLTPGVAAAQTDPAGLLVIRDPTGEVRTFEVQPQRPAPGAPVDPPVAGPSPAPPLGLPLALGFAFLGGLILNLMPCVFPVLAIKGLSLAGQGDLGTAGRLRHGLAYTAGVLVFFGALAGLLLGLRAGGTALGWGFQLQYPPFVAILADLFVILGLGLGGAYTLGAGLPGWAGGTSGRGLAGAFGTGALAALVASPCTAPFMGAALGYAVTLPWPFALAVLLTLGLGLATPFLALSLVPGLTRRLPRPGPWMEGFKQFLAFPLLATGAWLVWVLSVQTGPGGLALGLAGLLTLAFGLWVRERTLAGGGRRARFGTLGALAALGLALWMAMLTDDQEAPARPAPEVPLSTGQPGSGPASEPFSPERLAGALAQGRTVFVNLTAAWCITCLVNERVALSSAATAAAFRHTNTLYLKGDWTHRDPVITAYLARFGRNGVPLYVVYRPGDSPQVLPQVLGPDRVREALGAAR